MKELIIFVCTDSTEIFFSKLRSAGLNYNLPCFFPDSYCGGGGGGRVSNKHCLLTFFIHIAVVKLILILSVESVNCLILNNGSRVRFRSSDLWVLGPAHFHCFPISLQRL